MMLVAAVNQGDEWSGVDEYDRHSYFLAAFVRSARRFALTNSSHRYPMSRSDEPSVRRASRLRLASFVCAGSRAPGARLRTWSIRAPARFAQGRQQSADRF